MNIDPNKVNLLEKDIEDYLWHHPESIETFNYSINAHAPIILSWLARQFELPSGIADLIGLDTHGHIVVVEVKNVPIKKEAITQVCRYAKDVEESISFFGESDEWKNVWVRKVLVAPACDGQTFIEAAACGVTVCQFSLNFSVDVCETRWNKEYLRERMRKLEELESNLLAMVEANRLSEYADIILEGILPEEDEREPSNDEV